MFLSTRTRSTLVFLLFIPPIYSFNALFVSIGHAGHVIPLFELAKALKHHNVTFLTQPLARSFIDFNAFSNSSSFRVIYTNDSIEAFTDEKQKMQQLLTTAAEHSFFDGLRHVSELMRIDSTTILNKTIHLLMSNQFDVIIFNSVMKLIPLICEQINTPCVSQGAETFSNMLDLNLPNSFSLLSREQMTHLQYRVYNVIYTLRLGIILTKLLPVISRTVQSTPKIPGPFYDSFSVSKLMAMKSKCLELYSIPPTFYIPSYTDHRTKYLGAFIDESSIKYERNEFTEWIQTKADRSIIYGAFGTSSLIPFERMNNLIHGVAQFLIQTPASFFLLILSETNYQTYRKVLNEMSYEQYSTILVNSQRVRIENRFVDQKWVLQQNSVKLFLSHCGMGSCSEGVYFHKPFLCMPFCMDQFINAMTIEHSSIGLSLFVPPSLFQALLHPHDFHRYTFTAESVTKKLTNIWENGIYQETVRIMSLEGKHAGGLKRAVEEIEFLVELKGDLDRFAPFQSTLPFYQRYLLDVLFIFVVLPLMIVTYGLKKCCKRRRKVKTE